MLNLKKIAFEEHKCYKIVLNCKEELEDFYNKCGLNKTGYNFSYYNVSSLKE